MNIVSNATPLDSDTALILPILIEELFDEIRNRLKTAETKNLLDDEQLRLHTLFGKTLENALHVIDTQKIKVYRTEQYNIELFEITSFKNNYKLIPDVNYCFCDAFKTDVIEKETSYTCKHVLAVKLAKLLGKFEIHSITIDEYYFLINNLI